MPNESLFNDNEYIELKVWQSLPSGITPFSSYNAQWIENNLIALSDDPLAYMAYIDPYDPSIINNPDHRTIFASFLPAFSENNIYKLFSVSDDSLPIPTDLSAADAFSQNNIYTPFVIEPLPTPQPRTEPIDYNGVFSQFQMSTHYPFAREEPFIFGLDYNGIFSYFKIRENEFPSPAGWVEPFDQNGIFSIFGISNDNKFHGFPAPRTIPVFQDTVPPKGYTITFNMINTTKHLFAKDKKTHQGDSFWASACDRDVSQGAYLIFLENYWEARERNNNNNED